MLGAIYPAQHPKIYAELGRLCGEGLIAVASEWPRRRKAYRITDAGLAEIKAWLAESEVDHTLTPRIDADAWRLRIHGSGLRGGPVELTHRELRHLPSDTVTAAVECAGNGRSFFTSQQGQAVSGTAWKLGAVGVARWKGVRLSTVLKRAGLTRAAVDVQPVGPDPDFVSGGAEHAVLPPLRPHLPHRG